MYNANRMVLLRTYPFWHAGASPVGSRVSDVSYRWWDYSDWRVLVEYHTEFFSENTPVLAIRHRDVHPGHEPDNGVVDKRFVFTSDLFDSILLLGRVRV